MSRIYAAGVEATAKANILADIEDYISFNEQGHMVVDTQGLTLYLRTEFDSLPLEAVAPADAASVGAAVSALNVGAYVGPLNDAIKVQSWSGRADWPTTTNVVAGATMVASVSRLFSECERLSDDITNFYYDLNQQLPEFLLELFYEMNIDSQVPAGVTRLVENRAYIQTFVTDWDEESAPSPASTVIELDQNDTVTVTRVAAPGAHPAAGNIDRWRLYRSNESSDASDWQFVTEQPIGTATFEDTITSEELDGEICPTLTWDEPPESLAGLTRMPNNFLAGGYSNRLAFSEPNHYYAWPREYEMPLADPFVACAASGQTLVVGTRGAPKILTGADPSSMSEIMVDSNQACVSARSMVATSLGVMYASPDGLCLADSSGVRVVTKAHWAREDWQALNPSSIFAAECEGCYVFCYDTGSASGCYSFDPATGKLVSLTVDASTFFMDRLNDTLYATDGTAIRALFDSETRRTARWKTRKITLPDYEGFAWLQVDSDFANGAVTITLYGDGAQYYSVAISDRNPVRVPSGEYNEHEILVEGASQSTQVVLASSIDELMQ